jgi:sporulation integral membrane protein YtvI
MINPTVTYLERQLKFPRLFATFFIVGFVFFLMSGVFFFMITELIQGTTYLAEKIPDHFQTFIFHVESFLTNHIIPLYQKIISFIKTLNHDQQSTIDHHIQQFTTQITTVGTTFLKNLFLKIPAIISMIPYSITIGIFTIIATILITNDWFRLKHIVSVALPLKLKASSKNTLKHFEQSLIGFFKSQFILIFISASITFLGLLFLNIDHALTITLIVAVVDLLPLVGTGIVFLPWIGYLFITSNYTLTIGLIVVYMLVIIIRQIIEPKIISANIGTSPLVTLLAVFISIQFWGLFGVLIAPLLLVILNTCYKAGILSQVWDYIKG